MTASPPALRPGTHASLQAPRNFGIDCLRGLSILLVIVLGWSDLVHRHLFKSGLYVLCVGSCFLLLALRAHPPAPRRALAWLARTGSLSYELYLSHMFVVLAAVGLYRALLGEVQAWTFLVYLPVLLCCHALALILERIGRALPKR